ncbi:hypothetical protein CVIRNUC_008255 [Coccomyxa viridis]|uniref:t-SNARE coiled-coil homology domain-containing protein n=1 Tax=Coccomyxa viridis TaxID=1274662 RepID=A0AAV1IF29_9CHLO|nr:hypothetical protein CVIRNUC_008255 [Coccomyxa viridis]
MNITDAVTRADALVSKYEKYTTNEEKKEKGKLTDKFIEAFEGLVEKVTDLTLRSEAINQEHNRAQKAAQYAELRRAKAALLSEQLVALEKLVRKGKKVTPEIINDRLSKVQQMRQNIESVPDGVHGVRKGGPKRLLPEDAKGKARADIQIDASLRDDRADNDPDSWKHTDATRQFQQDWEVAKAKQDKALDSIERGIGTLKGIGEAMGETLKEQDMVLDAVDDKVNQATEQLKTNNMKLKGLLNQMRSSRNFCLDVVLICILLGLAVYLVELFKKKG